MFTRSAHDIIRRYLEGVNRFVAEKLGDNFPPYSLSDQEVIKKALDIAANRILDEDNQAAKQGLVRVLKDK